jgi:hypothetical protein
MFPQKLCLFGELQRFRRHDDLRAKFLLVTALESRKKYETEPSYELLGMRVRILCITLEN